VKAGPRKIRPAENVQEPEYFNAAYSFVPENVLRRGTKNLLRRIRKNEDRVIFSRKGHDAGPPPENAPMKLRSRSGRVLLAAILVPLVVFGHSANGQILVGTGEDFSYAVIEPGPFGTPLVYEYHYTYDASKPPDGYALLSAIDSADPSLSLNFLNFGTDGDPNYFLNAVTYGSTTLTSTTIPGGPFWAQWVSGGEAGFPGASPIESGTWSFGSGISAPYRAIGPGSWDGFVFNIGDTSPSIDPVPEPQSAVLLLAGITVVLWMVRRRRHEEGRV
jgi:hypothetical protein